MSSEQSGQQQKRCDDRARCHNSTYGHYTISVVWHSLPENLHDPECSADTFKQSTKILLLFSHYWCVCPVHWKSLIKKQYKNWHVASDYKFYVHISLSNPAEARNCPLGANFVQYTSPSWPDNSMIGACRWDVRLTPCTDTRIFSTCNSLLLALSLHQEKLWLSMSIMQKSSQKLLHYWQKLCC